MAYVMPLIYFLKYYTWTGAEDSDRFTHRPNRPWPRAPRFWGLRATLSYDDSILTKICKLRRSITSQFTLKREEMLMSTLDSYQHTNNTTILCIWVWERCRPSVWNRLPKRLKKKKRYLIDVQISTDKSSQQHKTARHWKATMKSNIVSIGSCVWVLLQDFRQT